MLELCSQHNLLQTVSWRASRAPLLHLRARAQAHDWQNTLAHPVASKSSQSPSGINRMVVIPLQSYTWLYYHYYYYFKFLDGTFYLEDTFTPAVHPLPLLPPSFPTFYKIALINKLKINCDLKYLSSARRYFHHRLSRTFGEPFREAAVAAAAAGSGSGNGGGQGLPRHDPTNI